MARKLQVCGTEEYVVTLTYYENREAYKNDEAIKDVFRYNYYEDAMEKYHELEAKWEKCELGFNAHVEVVKQVVVNEVFAYFG